jgi:5,10-methenyltetrahydrofolate synthetase
MTASIPPGSTHLATSETKADAKAVLRSSLLAARRTLSPQQRAAATAAIATRLQDWCSVHAIAELGVYWPIRQEPDLLSCYQTLHQSGIELALPVVLANDAALQFARWVPGQDMTTDRFGVAIPAQPHMIALPAALLIPCVGFNPQRFRLGYGGGFYDRTLAATPRPRTLGIAYACQAANFAGASHDITLDAIITESGEI